MSRMKSLYHYFKRDSVLPSPTGPLSKEVPATAITAANNSDLGPILIIAYFEFFTLQVCKKIIEGTRSENRNINILFHCLFMASNV